MNFGEIPFIKKHTELYETDPEKAHIWDSGEAGGSGPLPTLLLTTRGRKSGKCTTFTDIQIYMSSCSY